MYWIHPDYPDAASIFHSHLNRLIQMTNKKNGTPVYICIGTPAIFGDCLGPVIGTILSEYLPGQVYGTLDAPIHALNFNRSCREIKKQHQRPFIIAIDAALGNISQSGYILLKKGPLRPGKGVGKKLPPIGDLQITGVFQDIFDPKAGRQMAVFGKCISQGILKLYPAFQRPEQGDFVNIL